MSPAGRRAGSVTPALELIGWVARLGTGVSASELSAAAGIPPATCYRLLTALTADGYLVRVDELRGFALGRALEEVLGAAVPPFVPVAARDELARLRERIRFGVHLVLYPGDSVRIADADPDRPLRAPQLLQRYAHASAAGKLMLAHADERWSRPPTLTRLTEHTTVDRHRLAEELVRIRERGIAHQHGQLTADVGCVAVPIANHDGVGLAGAICLSGPVERVDRMIDEADVLARAAGTLTRLIS